MQLSDFASAPNLVRLFLDRADELGEKPFLSAKRDGAWQALSWAESARQVCLLAEALRAIRWMMGGLDVASYLPIVAALPFIVVALAAFAYMTRTLNLLSIGAEAAAARGVEIVAAQRLAFLSASLATGAAVSLGGPIGFIGIVVPHLVRLIVGSDHRIVLPASALFGGAFLVLCDVAARTLMSPLEIPVGVVTAMIGGPFFLWLLVKKS